MTGVRTLGEDLAVEARVTARGDGTEPASVGGGAAGAIDVVTGPELASAPPGLAEMGPSPVAVFSWRAGAAHATVSYIEIPTSNVGWPRKVPTTQLLRFTFSKAASCPIRSGDKAPVAVEFPDQSAYGSPGYAERKGTGIVMVDVDEACWISSTEKKT